MAYEVPGAVLADVRRTALDRFAGTNACIWPLILTRGLTGKHRKVEAVCVGIYEGKIGVDIKRRIFFTAFIEEGQINFFFDESVANKRRVVSISLGAEYKEDLLEQLDLVVCEL